MFPKHRKYGNYELKGQDVTVHLGKNATVQAEYAETVMPMRRIIIFQPMAVLPLPSCPLLLRTMPRARAYGIKEDARLFDRIGLKSYYKWIGDGFSTGGDNVPTGQGADRACDDI
jgi:hypothetical protein